MSNELAKQVADWLNGIDKKPVNGLWFDNAKPVIVTLDKDVYYGARYDMIWEPSGKRDDRFYLVGELPKRYWRNSHFCYRLPETGDKDWYIAGFNSTTYRKKQRFPEPKQEHAPFGDFFMLGLWTVQGKVDDGESPYKRLPMTVQSL